MKTLLALLIALPALGEPRSFDMVLSGVNGQPPPPTTHASLRRMIGDFVTDLDVRRYVQMDEPTGGGFHVCLEPMEPFGYEDIVAKLQTIGVGSSARWEITLVENCE